MASTSQPVWQRRYAFATGLAAIALAGFAIAGPITAGNPGFDPDTAGSEHPAELIVAQKCVMCHDLVIVTSRQASTDEWQEIIARMVTYGAQLSDEEIGLLVDYLASRNDQE